MPELYELVKVTLDKERHLRLTLKGMLEFEKLTGKNLMKGIKFKDLTFEDLTVMLWASLIDEDRELKYDDVLDMVDFNNLTVVMDALMECISQSLPKAPKAEEGDRPLAEMSQPG